MKAINKLIQQPIHAATYEHTGFQVNSTLFQIPNVRFVSIDIMNIRRKQITKYLYF